MAAEKPITKVTTITTDDDFTNHTSNLSPETLAILYFHAPWAAPCKQMSTVLETLASTYPVESPPTVVFLSIDAEELPDISEDHNVVAVPYIVLKKGGQQLDTISGGDATKVRDTVDKYAGKGKSVNVGLPPVQNATKLAEGENGSQESETATSKNPSSYAPQTGDPPTAPEYSSYQKTSKEELFTRLEQLVKAAPVMLFMKGTPSAPQCGFSRQTVSLLRDRSIRYGFFNILADDDVRQGLKEFSEWPTFPQLYVDGELVGGLDIIKEQLDSDPEFLTQYAVSKPATS